MTQIFLCLYTEDEEEDEDNTEPKAGLESDQKEDEESKDTKEGKTRLLCLCTVYVKMFFLHGRMNTLNRSGSGNKNNVAWQPGSTECRAAS